MQAIVNQTNRIGAEWYMDEVWNIVEKFGRNQQEVTPRIVAEAIVDRLERNGEEPWIKNVDTSRMFEGAIRPCDQLEIRFIDSQTGERVNVCRIGADSRNNIYVADAPKGK